MENTTTAKKFLENLIEENNHDSNIDLEDALIEFAKLHVEQALKEASEKAQCEEGAIVDLGFEIISASVDKQSILNSYSLDNIK
jgi:hypothetical protein